MSTTTIATAANIDSDLRDPIFPREIEEIIFSTAWEQDDTPPNPADLFLVAKRVYRWYVVPACNLVQTTDSEFRLLPIVFRTIVIRRSYWGDPTSWTRHRLSKFGPYARELLIRSLSDDLDSESECFEFCSNVTNLALWAYIGHTDNDSDPPSQLPLTELSMPLPDLYVIPPSLVQLYSKITHLDSKEAIYNWGDVKTLALFTSITHLAIVDSTRDIFIPDILEKCRKSEVLIYLKAVHDQVYSVVEPRAGVVKGVKDDRVVWIKSPHAAADISWVEGGGFGKTMWRVAEDVIERRRRGE